MGIIIKSDREIAAMRQAGKIVAEILAILKQSIQPGVKTIELDAIAEREIKKRGAIPSFKGYHGYPGSVCISINDQIVHGIPGKRVIKEGDLVSLDLGAIIDGFHGDSAVSVVAGKGSAEVNKLIETTHGALNAGIAKARAGLRLGDISAAIQQYAEKDGYSVVREYTGHGIGREMHEEPQILNYGREGTGPLLKKGMTLALEPMLNAGGWGTRVDEDCWTVYTADGSLSAHFEHSVAITDGDPQILTEI
ncbi:MAG: type I methionyl aminopeptidase [Chloroflexi bacterium]|nr:type I methionyl aminopeptidase [Chloroflexota bacterium]